MLVSVCSHYASLMQSIKVRDAHRTLPHHCIIDIGHPHSFLSIKVIIVGHGGGRIGNELDQ